MRWIYGFLLFVTFPLIARDWQQCPALATLTTTETIYALGDTHSDYKRAAELLVAAKLMPGMPASPAQATWSGGNSVLIVTGDMIDKWKHSLDVIALMRGVPASEVGSAS